MKVLHCSEIIKGGVASYLRDLVRLQRQDFGADSVALVVPASQMAELPVPEGVRVYPYSDHRGRAANAFELARVVLAKVREFQPEIVHIHCTYAGATVRTALWLLARKVRLVYCPHGWAFNRPLALPGYTMVRLVEKLLANVTETIVCISEHERQSAVSAGIRPDRLKVVLNGVSVIRPLGEGEPPPWKQGRTRLLFAGRFDHQKGIDILFEALRTLGDKVHAIVAGDWVLADGPPLDVPDNATLTGWLTQAQLERLFESADVLVVPSRWEGFGLIAVEAMRAGLAVMATRVGGLPEIIEDESCGVLVEPGSAEDIVRGIEAHDREDWARMGRNGPDRVARLFLMERVHREICDLYGVGRETA